MIRDWSGQGTLAGGLVLETHAARRGFRGESQQAFLESRAADPGNLEILLATTLRRDHLLPLSALAFGFVYATDYSMDRYLPLLAAVAAAPVVLTAIADQKGSKEAVMLPLIDSANHLQEADSVIEYDPSVDGFVLSLGRKCLVKEGDGTAQVCISYGIRKDAELLLNYGFLRGVATGGAASRDEVRQRLAEEFVARNP